MSDLPQGSRASVRVGLVSTGVVVAGLLAAVPAATAAGPAATADRAVSQAAVTGVPAAGTRYAAGRYVVLLREPSAATYDGSDSRFAATRSSAGLSRTSSAVRAYTSHLRSTHTSIAGEFGTKALRSFTVASNGFVADLTKSQALDLATDRRVLLLEKQTLLKPTTWNTPNFLGLTGPNGAWTRHGGQAKAGDGVVVADLDSGIWPESKSFKGQKLTSKEKTRWDISRKGEATRMEKADGGLFTGECTIADGWNAGDCNTKIIGARYYDDWVANNGVDALADTESISARDGGGHGTHTASTAAGNRKGNVTVEGRKFGAVSGMAPAARIAAYKVCWEGADPDDSGCVNSDILAAIDDAVLDGADVLNFSIGGGASPTLDSTEVAFEGAAEAGIFVSASAGNSGPGASTLDHPSPWLTTVAAGTHYNYENTIVLGNKQKIKGASISSTPVGKTRLVLAEDAVAAGADAGDASLCGPDTLDPAKTRKKIVVCLRGVFDRVAKSAEVKRVGGKAMILVNPSENSLDADFHAVPTIHISDTDGTRLFRYMNRAGSKAKAAFKLGNLTKKETPLPQVTGFSSRGPILVSNGDMLKPDITAPGASVLAAVSPPSNSGRRYDLYSGTSMAAPHITGLAAFMQGLHPSWTPMEIKSAMMTTSKRTKTDNGGLSNDNFAQGAGQVQPKRFLDPGLFVTATPSQWRGFITSQGLDTGVPAIDAKQINLPSMADGSLTASTTFHRSFRATQKGTWKISSSVPGFKLTTNRPRIRSDRRNDIIDINFTFTRTNAPLGSYSQGAVTLTGPTKLRLPVSLKALSVAAPAEVSGEGVSGSVPVDVTGGFTGDLDLTATGLSQGERTTDSVAVGDATLACVTVAPGSKLARFRAYADDQDADIDLFVYAAGSCDPATATALVGQSATASGDEKLDVAAPEAGTYLVEVDGFSAPAGGDPTPYTLDFFDVNASSTVGTFTVSPDPVAVSSNRPASYDASWSGLTAGAPYLGIVEYAGTTDTTLVSVEAP